MSDVKKRDGGPYSLFCYDCRRWIPNTANNEMGREGYFAHSHSCHKTPDGEIRIWSEQGIPEIIKKPIILDDYRIAGGNLSWPDDPEERKSLLDAVASRWEEQPDFFGNDHDLLVFDEGKEVFGRFHSIIAAAKAVRESNHSWWAVGPAVAPNSGEEIYDIEYEDEIA